ncbi:MAG: PSD1 and planctomycete cytochrome C domain-containing protein [Chthoniobacteraceae bacterium]
MKTSIFFHGKTFVASRLWLLPTILLAASFEARAQEITKEQTEFFESKIRPVLADTCYRCHSADAGKSKGGLTLDSRDAILKGGETGPAVVPGDATKSLLIKAINYGDPDLQMPPSSTGGKLSDVQIADLTTWVKMGAPVPANATAIKSKLSGMTDKARGHWSYQPVKIPKVPINKNQQWCRTPLDCFILQKTEAAKMVPSPDADRETLLRRASYDLIGLPPSPQEIESFLADKSPDAWAHVVDRLLASPHYGERWGRHWLDTARYSDTAGENVRGDEYRYAHAWTYRDWVVSALNADMPYDKFVSYQLAADLMPKEQLGYNSEHLAALGFITVGERFGNPNDLINERIDTVSKAMLAMTVSCARCHDHMFDPISQKDYYALHGVFSSITEPNVKPLIGSLPPKDQLADFVKKEAGVKKEVASAYYESIGHFNQTFRLKSPLYLELVTLSRDPISITEKISSYTKFRTENKLDDDIGRRIEARTRKKDDTVFGPLAVLSALKPDEFAAKSPAIIAQAQAGLLPGTTKKPVNRLVALAFRGAKPGSIKSIKDVWQIYDNAFAMVAGKSAVWLDEMAVSSSDNVPGVDAAMSELLQIPFEVKPGGSLSIADFRQLIDRLPNNRKRDAQGALAELNILQLTHPGAPAYAMVVADKPKPQDSPVFIRGQANTRGDIVPRRFLDVLSPTGKGVPFTQGSGRLELAKCIADKANPRTARVMVNRVWMHHFGEGLVSTPDDLGTMAETPTHPELLDYLANYFTENGWSLKKLHRTIMLSRTYQQSSHILEGSDYTDKDPYNRLLWRANVRRLDFESVRDSLLVMSGKLDRSIGGKPVNVTEEPYLFRRSVYGYVDRGNLPELMAHFDFAKPEMANSKRTTTIVPQQALFLMNSPFAVAVARSIVSRPEFPPIQKGESTDYAREKAAYARDLARISALYRIIFQRMPKADEYKMGLAFVRTETQDWEANNFAAKTISKGGRNRMDARAAIKNDGFLVHRGPLNQWETYAQALIFSNEAAYVN